MKKYELTRYELVRVRVDRKPFWPTLSGCLLNAVTALKKSTFYPYAPTAQPNRSNTTRRALGADLFVALF